MARPFHYRISKLIDDGREAEARREFKELMQRSGGTLRGVQRESGASYATVNRWAAKLGIPSFYDGTAGGIALREKRRQIA